MGPTRSFERSVKPRLDSDDGYVSEDGVKRHFDGAETNSDTDASAAESSDQDEDESDNEEESVSGGSDEEVSIASEKENAEDLKDISFGALAKAQESIGLPPSRSRKRKLSDEQSNNTNANTTDERTIPQKKARSEKYPDSKPNQPLQRSSKHAPTILSSKHPVSRKREIFEPSPALKSRDPRFDATITSTSLNPSAIEKADRNYSFLTTYQATEVLNLKAQIRKTKDPDLAADLKRQVMSLESKIRNAETRDKEREILKKHKQQEKQAIREGKKARPYFLKPSDVRKQIEKERVEGMGKKARDKMEKRKIKRQKGKEGRDMPRFRRAGGD